MNYIKLINQFWEKDLEYSFTGNETKLYFYLLHICNTLGWKNPFKHSLRQISKGVGISINSIKSARKILVEAGLISFENGKQGRAIIENKTQYQILTASNIDISITDNHTNTLNDTVNKLETKQTYLPLISPTGEKPLPELIFPHNSEKFIERWKQLRSMPKWKKKKVETLQMSLNKLKKYDEEFAIELIEQSIMCEYQGVVFKDTDIHYSNWQRSKNKVNKINRKRVNETLWDR